MTPFQIFRKLLHRVGLFGRVTYEDIHAVGLGKPDLTAEDIADLAINQLTLDEREVLIAALSIKNLERAVDPTRNKEILSKAGINISPVEVERNTSSNYIKPSPDAVMEILQELSPKETRDTVDVERLIDWAVKENRPFTEFIGTLSIDEETQDIPHSSK